MDKIIEIGSTTIKNTINVNDLSSTSLIQVIAAMFSIIKKISIYDVPKIDLGDNSYFIICDNAFDCENKKCVRYSIKKSYKASPFCHKCLVDYRNKKKRIARSEYNENSINFPGSRVNNLHLTNDQLRVKLNFTTSRCNYMTKSIKKFKYKIEALQHELVERNAKDNSYLSALHVISYSLSQNPSFVRRQLVELLFNHHSGTYNDINSTQEQKISWFIEQVEYHNKQLDKKEKQVRYSP